MSKIRSSKTKPELALRKAIRGLGFSYQPKIRFNPDFAHRKKKIAVFVDGDFWHGYNWQKLGKLPPKGFWQRKIIRNLERDIRYTLALKEKGWKVIRIWEHQIKKDIGQVKRIIMQRVKN